MEGQTIMMADGARLAAEDPPDPLIDCEDASKIEHRGSKSRVSPRRRCR
jgi:hypothetical protein